jgi:hypothetical protein
LGEQQYFVKPYYCKRFIHSVIEILIDTHANFLASVLGTLFSLSLEGVFLTSQQIVSILVDLELGDDALGGVNGDIDGGTYSIF